ncbi:hypothetical protein ACPF8X_36655 [Streptomyces sp. G35A]
MKFHEDWKKILKTYSFLSIVANLLVAISISGLGVMGVLSSQVAFGTLAISASVLGLLGVVGWFVDQSYDDMRGEGDKDV